MATQNYLIPDHIHDYMLRISLREPDVLKRLRQETAEFPKGGMQITPELGQFLRLLVELTGARNAIELGTFTGYSALSVALTLPADGRLIACDVNEEALAVARRYWAEAGVADKIDLRVGEISETLPGLVEQFDAGSFDFAFIDADKPGYVDYFEACLGLLRPGGLMVFDNIFMGGTVTDPDTPRKYVDSMRAFNLRLLDDQRITLSTLPVADGVTLVRKL